jgi:hypothetical protein
LRPSDIWAVVADLRDADMAEITALVGEDGVFGAVVASAQTSTEAWTLVADDQPIAVFGVAPADMPAVGIPWMVGTPGVLRNRRAFMRLCKVYIPKMLALFPTLVNVVDARNLRAIAWLKHAGFSFGSPAPFGMEGLPFYPFSMKA